jgi:hypothetical protein
MSTTGQERETTQAQPRRESTNAQPEASFTRPEPQKEHLWLQKLVGEWTFEAEASMGDGKPNEKTSGTERVRSLDGLWTVAEDRAK